MLPITRCGGRPYASVDHVRMKSAPPPEKIQQEKPLLSNSLSSSSIGWYTVDRYEPPKRGWRAAAIHFRHAASKSSVVTLPWVSFTSSSTAPRPPAFSSSGLVG